MGGFIGEVTAWFTDPANWTGLDGIPNRMWEHIQMSTLAMLIAGAFAIPAAVFLAHRRLGGSLVVAVVNIGRAVPSFAVVAVSLPITIRLGLGLGFWPTLLALLFLAAPPLFSNAHAGVSGVDPALVDAAQGMGMKEIQVMTRVEVPLAMPVLMAGARAAAVQVVATATLGALVAWGGLGRYIIDGFATQNTAEVFAGGLLVAILAVATEIVFATVERITTSRKRSQPSTRAVAGA